MKLIKTGSPEILIPEEESLKIIFHIREENVILDMHLAELYGVETRVLKQSVKRNRKRFPPDFLFELNEIEMMQVVSQNVIPHKKFFGGAVPYTFTESGIVMSSTVLKSERAIDVNISIIRTFIELRKYSTKYKELSRKLEELKQESDEKFADIFVALDYILNPQENNNNSRKRIGFNPDELS